MINVVDKQLLELLKSALWGGPIKTYNEFKDWGSLFAIAKSQAVLGLIANAALTDSCVTNLIHEKIKVKLKTFMMTNIATYNLVNNTLLKVVAVLEQAEIPYVLLKGQALARNYPAPELRACGDIDIYVGQDNYLKACAVLSTNATWKENVDPLENLKHYDLKIGAVSVEVHRFSEVLPSKYYNRIYQTYSDDGLRNNVRVVDFSGISVRTPADDFNAFYIFNHMWHHFLTSGVGLRQICDWMLFLRARKNDINTDKLRKIIEDMNLMKPWQVFGCILVNELGMPQEEFPFYNSHRKKDASKVLRYILTEGNFGHDRDINKNRHKESYIQRKVKSAYLHTKRYIPLFFMFAPHVLRHYSSVVRTGLLRVWTDLLNFHSK